MANSQQAADLAAFCFGHLMDKPPDPTDLTGTLRASGTCMAWHSDAQALTQQQAEASVVQTLAEKVAWKIAKEAKLDLVTICPNFVLGPVLSRRTSGTSIGYMKVGISSHLLEPSLLFRENARGKGSLSHPSGRS